MKYSIIIIIISLIISLSLAVFLLFPAYQEFQATRNSLLERKNELQNHRQYQARLEEMRNNLVARQDLVDKINSALPSEPDMASFLNFLNTASYASGVSIENVSWQETSIPRQRNIQEEWKERVKLYNVNLNFSASYFAFKNFLYSLEKSARLIEVSNINFQMPDSLEKPIKFKTNLKIYSY